MIIRKAKVKIYLKRALFIALATTVICTSAACESGNFQEFSETAVETTTTAIKATTAVSEVIIPKENTDITDKIPDDVFRAQIRKTLKLEANAPIMSYDVAKITVFIFNGGSDDHNELFSLEGIQYFTSLEHIEIRWASLTSLPPLPDSLTTLIVNGNYLTELPELPDSLTVLDVCENSLKELSALPDTLEELAIGGNNFTELPELPGSLKMLWVYKNNLISLPDLPDTLTMLSITENKFRSLPPLPDSLTEIYAFDNPLLHMNKIIFKDGTTALEREKAGTLELNY